MADAIPQSTHWRDSARNPRFFMIDFRAVFPVFLLLLHIRWWSFAVTVVAIFFFTMLERYGFTVVVFFRWLRAFLAGSRKVSAPWWKR
ncbi:MAG: IcmT/TraK family protein [Proteobacteria bacterium]|nr:IcmT/TraK family protein [Pseudomonadota bacterium]